METWETTRSQRWTISLAIAALTLLPVLLADTNYETPAPAANLAPALRIFARASGSLALVPPGGPFPARCCSPILNRQTAPLGTDELTRRDMLLLLPVDASQSVTSLQVRIVGESGLQATVDPQQQLEVHTYPNDTGPAAADGHHVLNGWVARVRRPGPNGCNTRSA